MNPHSGLQMKICRRCGHAKMLVEFYERSYSPGAYTSECKACMRQRSKFSSPLDKLVARTPSETLVIEYLNNRGIYAVPGKAVSYAHVDIVAWGCVGIEVKYSREREGGRFIFSATPAQQQHGFRADVVCLVFDYPQPGARQFHFFHADDELFVSRQRGERVKSKLTFVTRRDEHPLTDDARLRESRDRIALIEECRSRMSEKLKRGDSPFAVFGMVSAPLWTEAEAAEFMRSADLIDETRQGLHEMSRDELLADIDAQRKLLDALERKARGG